MSPPELRAGTGSSGQDLTVRPATPDDLDGLAALVQVTRRAAEPDLPPLRQGPVELRTFLESRVALGEVWLAEDEQPAGVAILTRDWLHSLYVGPRHQGRGIGSVLLELVKAQRPGGFGLWVFAANDSARGFYRRHGLIELEHTDGSANDEGAPDIRMVWPGERPLEGLRRWINEIDEELAELLARRFALTAAVQGEKAAQGEPAGPGGRDPEREAAIVERMARHAPGLNRAAVARIMDVVIAASLDQWHRGADRSG